ncbi:MAG: hypothetical protein ACXVXG_15025 [Nocardioidaceae bacterium]
MASRKQRQAKLHRAQHATNAKRDRAKTTARAGADLAAWLTDERLLGWGRAEGLDLTDREQLLDSAAVGLTVLLWRNTELENIHASCELKVRTTGRVADIYNSRGSDDELSWADRAVQDHIDKLFRALDAGVPTYTGVADPAEEDRIELLLEQRHDEGVGIPDDVMMRLNASTAAAVRDLLDGFLEEEATTPGAEIAYDPEGVPDFLFHTYDYLLDWDREEFVGPTSVPIAELFGERGWQAYRADVERKVSQPIGLIDLIGARRALWYLALSGATYARNWWPNPHWAGAVADLRAAVAEGDPERITYIPRGDLVTPAADDEEFWAALTEAPHELNGAQARWAMFSRIDQYLRQRRTAAAEQLGAADAERFPIFSAMF